MIAELPGGPVAVALHDLCVGESEQRSVEQMFRRIAGRIERLGEWVDRQTVVREELTERTTMVIHVARRTTREEQLMGSANIVANSSLRADDRERLDFGEAACFIRGVDQRSSSPEVLRWNSTLAARSCAATARRSSVRELTFPTCCRPSSVHVSAGTS